jgi:hypothetical protein
MLGGSGGSHGDFQPSVLGHPGCVVGAEQHRRHRGFDDCRAGDLLTRRQRIEIEDRRFGEAAVEVDRARRKGGAGGASSRLGLRGNSSRMSATVTRALTGTLSSSGIE